MQIYLCNYWAKSAYRARFEWASAISRYLQNIIIEQGSSAIRRCKISQFLKDRDADTRSGNPPHRWTHEGMRLQKYALGYIALLSAKMFLH